MVPWTTVPFLSSMVTVSLFSFIKNLREKTKSSTKLGEVGTKRSGEGQRGASRNKGRMTTGALPDELHLGGPGGGREGRRRRRRSSSVGGSRWRAHAVGFLGAGGVNPSFKADLAYWVVWTGRAVRIPSNLVGPLFRLLGWAICCIGPGERPLSLRLQVHLNYSKKQIHLNTLACLFNCLPVFQGNKTFSNRKQFWGF